MRACGANVVDCFAVGIYPEAAFESKRFLFPPNEAIFSK